MYIGLADVNMLRKVSPVYFWVISYQQLDVLKSVTWEEQNVTPNQSDWEATLLSLPRQDGAGCRCCCCHTPPRQELHTTPLSSMYNRASPDIPKLLKMTNLHQKLLIHQMGGSVMPPPPGPVSTQWLHVTAELKSIVTFLLKKAGPLTFCPTYTILCDSLGWWCHTLILHDN